MSISASDEFADRLLSALSGVLHIDARQVELLAKHYEHLVRWNQVVNLTAIHRLADAVSRHYCESLFLGAQIPEGRWKIADLGSGAGFPGFPIAVLRPECRVTLIESHQRKAAFLKEMARLAGNVRVLTKRAEEVTERFDWVVCRAVRLDQIMKVLLRIAGNAGLLTAGEVLANSVGFRWEPPIPVPFVEGHFVVLGANVSRETFEAKSLC